MPSYEQLAKARGVVQGLDALVTNFQNIRQAKKELETKDQKDKMELKIRGMQLKQLEADLDPETLSLEQEKLKADVSAQKVQNQLNAVKIREVETKIRKDIETQKTMEMFRERFSRGEETEIPPGMSISSTGAWTMTGQAEEDPFKGATKYKKEQAQKSILGEYLKVQEEEQGLQKSAVGYAKDFFVKPKATEVLKRYGKTTDDVFNWAKENYPDMARAAFPGRMAMEKEPRGAVR